MDPRRCLLIRNLPTSGEIQILQGLLLDWYRQNKRQFPWRLESAKCYEKIVAEVLLQRTNAETVSALFPKFISKFNSWEKIAEARKEELVNYLRPLGLWRRRVESILRLATEMVNRNGIFPSKREEIESLPNMGQYITNAVLLFCHNEPQPLLDVNMARVLERYFGPRKLADIRDDPYLQFIASSVVSGEEPKLLNWALLDLGRYICKSKSPHHEICPLLNSCRFLLT